MTRAISPWVANARQTGLRLLLAAAVIVSAACSTAGSAPREPATPADGSAGAYPRTNPSPFWAPDDPIKQPDAAFGKLTPTASVITEGDGKPQTFAIKRFVLDTALPTTPAKISVYMSGVYPGTNTNAKITDADWEYVPAYALVGYRGKPLTHHLETPRQRKPPPC